MRPRRNPQVRRACIGYLFRWDIRQNFGRGLWWENKVPRWRPTRAWAERAAKRKVRHYERRAEVRRTWRSV